jgi:hypothetical protein
MKLLRNLGIVWAILLASSSLWAAEEFLVLADGAEVKVLFFEPLEKTQAPPLALLISGGSSNDFMARAQFWLGKELRNRGWAIAVPISPDGNRFSVANAALFPELIKQLHTSHELKAGKPLLLGISSGGTGLAIATRNPGAYLGVVATPGRISRDSTLGSLDGLAIYLRIGEQDNFRWNRRMDAMVQRLRGAGARVDAAIVADARHIFTLDWENLENWLENIQ